MKTRPRSDSAYEKVKPFKRLLDLVRLLCYIIVESPVLEEGGSMFPASTSCCSNCPEGLTCSLVFAIFAAVLGMVQFGYNTAVINAPQKVIQEFISAVHMSRTGNMISEDTRDLIWSIAVSIFAIGGMVGGITGGTIATKFGRRSIPRAKKTRFLETIHALTSATKSSDLRSRA
ncbi:hypothetical protein TNCT_636441 [Trichonephila clavata]|uniref:Major facilitator superfamily (MFS) profile domain-containing protein n=1 Tax=Trichonephila clavata TaxID=2740835 RepID=A0A8X6K9M7_TRICU|nr:hypothetical protein TNCT_636441 [Trichonephila clavata]